MKAKRRARPSLIWSSLLHERELLKRGMMWQIRDGREVNFWEDKWIPQLPSLEIQTPRPQNYPINQVANTRLLIL